MSADVYPCQCCLENAPLDACDGTTRWYRCEQCCTTTTVDLREFLQAAINTEDRQ